MKRNSPRIVLGLLCMLTLAGCDTFGGVTDTVGGWFSSTHKSKIKGERISVMTTDESLRPDPELAKSDVVLPAPYANTQ